MDRALCYQSLHGTATGQDGQHYWELFSLTLADAGQSGFPLFANISQARTEKVLAAQIANHPLIEQRGSRMARVTSAPTMAQ